MSLYCCLKYKHTVGHVEEKYETFLCEEFHPLKCNYYKFMGTIHIQTYVGDMFLKESIYVIFILFVGKLAVIVEDDNGNKEQIHEIASYSSEKWAQIGVAVPQKYTGQKMSVRHKCHIWFIFEQSFYATIDEWWFFISIWNVCFKIAFWVKGKTTSTFPVWLNGKWKG